MVVLRRRRVGRPLLRGVVALEVDEFGDGVGRGVCGHGGFGDSGHPLFLGSECDLFRQWSVSDWKKLSLSSSSLTRWADPRADQ